MVHSVCLWLMILEMKTGRGDLEGCTYCARDISWCSWVPMAAGRHALIRWGKQPSTILFLSALHSLHRWVCVIVYSWEGFSPCFSKSHFYCKDCWWLIRAHTLVCVPLSIPAPQILLLLEQVLCELIQKASWDPQCWTRVLLLIEQTTGSLPQTCAHSCLNPPKTISMCLFWRA